MAQTFLRPPKEEFCWEHTQRNCWGAYQSISRVIRLTSNAKHCCKLLGSKNKPGKSWEGREDWVSFRQLTMPCLGFFLFLLNFLGVFTFCLSSELREQRELSSRIFQFRLSSFFNSIPTYSNPSYDKPA